MKKVFFIIILFLIWILLSPAKGLSQDNEDVKTISTEGASLIVNDNLAQARNNAIQDAIQKAVEQVIIALMPEKTASNQAQTIRDNFYTKAMEYIHDYRIISEKQQQTVYMVTVRSTLSVSSIRDDLQGLGILIPENKHIPLTEVSFTVRGLKSYSDYAKVKELLKTKIKAVRNIYLRRFEWGMAGLDLEIQGTVQSFTSELVKTGHFPLDNIRAGQNYIEVTFLR